MRRYAAITVATAALVIGGGVAVGSARNSPAPTPKPSPMPSLSQIEQSLQTQCEQSVARVQGKYTEAYDAGCNSGSATLTVP
jgi:hypothetical protein